MLPRFCTKDSPANSIGRLFTSCPYSLFVFSAFGIQHQRNTPTRHGFHDYDSRLTFTTYVYDLNFTHHRLIPLPAACSIGQGTRSRRISCARRSWYFFCRFFLPCRYSRHSTRQHSRPSRSDSYPVSPRHSLTVVARALYPLLYLPYDRGNRDGVCPCALGVLNSRGIASLVYNLFGSQVSMGLLAP